MEKLLVVYFNSGDEKEMMENSEGIRALTKGKQKAME